MQRARKTVQGGFAIVTAIFLIVVLAALGAFMVTISTTQNITSAQDVQGERAYQAARTGVEWGVYQILQKNAAAFASNCRAGTAGFFPQPLPALGGTLTTFGVSVDCNATFHNEGTHLAANPLWIYHLTSTATINGSTVGAMGYVDRQISVTLEK